MAVGHAQSDSPIFPTDAVNLAMGGERRNSAVDNGVKSGNQVEGGILRIRSEVRDVRNVRNPGTPFIIILQ